MARHYPGEGCGVSILDDISWDYEADFIANQIDTVLSKVTHV